MSKFFQMACLVTGGVLYILVFDPPWFQELIKWTISGLEAWTDDMKQRQ